MTTLRTQSDPSVPFRGHHSAPLRLCGEQSGGGGLPSGGRIVYPPAAVLKAIGAELGMPLALLCDPSQRSESAVLGRKLAAHALDALADHMSMAKISVLLGYRAHTTVVHVLGRMEAKPDQHALAIDFTNRVSRRLEGGH